MPWVLTAHFVAENLPKPILRVKPDSMVSMKTKVTFLCEGTKEATEYKLYKEGDPYSYHTQISLMPRKKAGLLTINTDQHHAGRYRCYYHTETTTSESSEPLELVVTGEREHRVSSIRVDLEEVSFSQWSPFHIPGG